MYRKLFEPSLHPDDMARTLTEAILPLQETRADAVVLIAGGAALYEALRQMRSRLPATFPLYTISSVNWQDLVKNLGAAVTVEALRRAGPEPARRSIVNVLHRMGRQQFGGFEVNYSAARRLGFGKPEVTLITSQGTLLR